jgi:hypothetical protein
MSLQKSPLYLDTPSNALSVLSCKIIALAYLSLNIGETLYIHYYLTFKEVRGDRVRSFGVHEVRNRNERLRGRPSKNTEAGH